MKPFKELKEYKTIYVRGGSSNYELRAKIVQKPSIKEPALLLTKVYTKDGESIETTKLGRLPLAVLNQINLIIQDAIKFIQDYGK